MTGIFIAMFLLIIATATMANYMNNKNDEEYTDYLLQLDEIKKRKKAREGPQVGTYKTNDDGVWIDL